MKFDILEKVGELTITQIRSAEENRKIAKAENERQAELKRIKEEKEEQEKIQKIQNFLPLIMEKIDKTAESGGYSLEILWMHGTKNCGLGYWEFLSISQKIVSILENLGYSAHCHDYSASWTTRSGKEGYLYISWHS